MRNLLLRTPEMKKFLLKWFVAAVVLVALPVLLNLLEIIPTWLFIVLITIGLLLIFIISYMSLRDNLMQAMKASEFTDSAMQPGFKGVLPEISEGVYYTLNHNINMLIKRQQSTSENLTREKVFLKNLVSDISHQMKTPLASLILNHEMLLKKHPDNELLELSRGQLDRMEVLVINLLKYARLEADSVIFTPDREDVVLTINNSIRVIEAPAKTKDINIVFNPDDVMKIKHDGSWLEEALINILKNAVEHTPEGGRISIVLTSTGISNKITIEDTGSGIPENELPYIFDRFYKGKTGINPTSIGIGLSLSRLIIEGLDGTIRAENLPSSGARFIISFPTY